jgi:hypothetical protein
MPKKPKNKNREPFFHYTQNDFEYDIMMGREFWSVDSNFKLTLYRVDIVKSKTHEIYGSVYKDDKKFLTPIELTITLTIGNITNNFLSQTGIVNETFENFRFGVYLQELEEKNCQIKRGDYVKYNDGKIDRYFEVTSISNIDTNNTAYGFKPLYKMVECIYVKKDSLPSL